MSPKQKVSFINKQGKRVTFWAIRQTDRAAKYGARKISEYGKKKVPYKPYKTPAQRKAAANRTPQKQSSIRVGYTVRTRQGIGKVVEIRQSRALKGRIAVVKMTGKRGEFSRLVFRTNDVERVK